MIGKRIGKPLVSKKDFEEYRELAGWCNNIQTATIEEFPPCAEYPSGYYEVVHIPPMTEEEKLAEAKAERAVAVAAITVVVDGMTFDGDEKAQERMARAVVLADSVDETTEWVLHNNTVAIVTADQLRRACKAAGKAQTELWVVPYTS